LLVVVVEPVWQRAARASLAQVTLDQLERRLRMADRWMATAR
jgi:hypothetical protein